MDAPYGLTPCLALMEAGSIKQTLQRKRENIPLILIMWSSIRFFDYNFQRIEDESRLNLFEFNSTI